MLIFLGVVLGTIIVYSIWYGITPTPTSEKVSKHLILMLPKLAHKNIVELGSGWGSLCFVLARHYPDCKIKGFEISPFPFLISKAFTNLKRLSNVTLYREDFFSTPLNNASLVVCYLYPRAMERLKKKFKTELKPEAYVLSHTFAIPGWHPIRVECADDLYRTPIYLYQVVSV